MPLNFLRRIENADFPLTITDGQDIRNAAVLVAAGMLEADLPSPETNEGVAVVRRITPLGRVELGRTKGTASAQFQDQGPHRSDPTKVFQ